MQEFLQAAKRASSQASILESALKKKILNEMADALEKNSQMIIDENRKDLDYAKDNNLSSAMVDRLMLDSKRVLNMANSLREIAMLKEPVGRALDGWQSDDGLNIVKVSVPIGVVGVIYESRPNVTADVGALCFKSGNVAILKGGKEAQNSNSAIATILQDVLEDNGLPKEIISLLPDSSREGVDYLIKQDKYVDLIVPRGGEGLIKYISQNSTVPIVKHDKGLCHTYIEKSANVNMAINIAVNAKCDRPGVCNSMETLLVDRDIAKTLLPKLKDAFDKHNTELRVDRDSLSIIEAKEATEKDYDTEYLANILNIKIVDGLDDAIEHITKYGSLHSEAIITQDFTKAEEFLNRVDASTVYVNASTRFTDGGKFGFGAEVGISTNKLHARGPMGINELTTYKYKVYGNGQIRE